MIKCPVKADLAAYSVPPSPGGGGKGGLRPPFLALRTPMQSIGYGDAERPARGGERGGVIEPQARVSWLTPPWRAKKRADLPLPGEGGHRVCGNPNAKAPR